MNKVLALNEEGNLTYCTAPEDMRGRGRCNHVAHQNSSETQEVFLERVSEMIGVNQEKKTNEEETKHLDNIGEISQDEINKLALVIDGIAGVRVTSENWKDVISKLPPEKISQIVSLAFDASPKFSLPISDENYKEETLSNQLYFANLPEYGIAGNKPSLVQMFEEVGNTPTLDGEYYIDRSYKEGLTPEQYFMRSFGARAAMIAKNVSTAAPGYSARKLFYGMSDTMVVKDCGGTHESALSCLLPEGHICEKCAHSTKGGHNVKVGDYVGGLVSTNLSEPLTQLSMKQMHVGSSEAANQQDHAKIIMATYDGWGTSPIVAKAKEAKDYLEARQIIADELKEVYRDAGVAEDPFNIEMVARKMTSYKRVPGVGLVPVQDGEMCTIVGMQSIGNSSNIFKNAELSSGYKILTKPVKQEIKQDAVNPLLV